MNYKERIIKYAASTDINPQFTHTGYSDFKTRSDPIGKYCYNNKLINKTNSIPAINQKRVLRPNNLMMRLNPPKPDPRAIRRQEFLDNLKDRFLCALDRTLYTFSPSGIQDTVDEMNYDLFGTMPSR